MSDTTGPLVGRRVLLVEDEYLIVAEMERWLYEAGAVVVGPVPSVEQALELIDGQDQGLDAAVLDVNLGWGETAYPIADKLGELGVPYLFATGDVRINGAAVHRESPLLQKPILRAALLRAVEKLLPTIARSVA